MFDYDIYEGRLVVAIERAWLSAGGVSVGRGRLAVQQFRSLTVREYNFDEGGWLPSTPLEKLKDLCEVDFTGDQVLLRGFSRGSGLWTEFNIAGGVAYYETLP